MRIIILLAAGTLLIASCKKQDSDSGGLAVDNGNPTHFQLTKYTFNPNGTNGVYYEFKYNAQHLVAEAFKVRSRQDGNTSNTIKDTVHTYFEYKNNICVHM